MTPGSSNSFPSTGHLELLVKAQESLSRVTPLIDKAEACGIDCTEYRDGVAYMGKKIDSFRSNFFPDQILPPDGSRVPKDGG